MFNATHVGGRVPLVLLLLRLGVFIVMFIWAPRKIAKAISL
jgi:hypothetical protein